MDGEEQKTETKRDRVRRLLLTPLAEMGFRFPKGTAADEGQRRLDGIADDLAYLGDVSLKRLQLAMRDKGEGSARTFWPTRATFVAYAQMAEPRPLHELPGLASWFGSEAGRRALAGERLVAEFRFWLHHHRPPMNDTDRQRIASRAAEWRDRAMRIRDKARRGWDLDQADADWLRAYENDEQRARALVKKEQAA